MTRLVNTNATGVMNKGMSQKCGKGGKKPLNSLDTWGVLSVVVGLTKKHG